MGLAESVESPTVHRTVSELHGGSPGISAAGFRPGRYGQVSSADGRRPISRSARLGHACAPVAQLATPPVSFSGQNTNGMNILVCCQSSDSLAALGCTKLNFEGYPCLR